MTRPKRGAQDSDKNDQPVVKLKRIDTNVTTQNRFSLLNLNDDSEVIPSANQQAKKPAPITITNPEQGKKVDELLKALNVGFRYKFISVGKKILCDNDNDKQKIEDTLSKNKIEFFSHPTNNEKIFKIVLSGLPEIPVDEIKKSLMERNNLNPIKIFMFNTKYENKLYLLHFNKNEVSKSDVTNIKVVYNHLIQWRPYRNQKKGPTQCYNCGMFGHGASCCHRPPSCLLCGKNHLTNLCPFSNSNANDDNSQTVYKCINCSRYGDILNHKASDPNCPARGKYLLTKTNRKNTTQSKNRNSKLGNDKINQNHILTTPLFSDAPTPPLLTKTYAAAVRTSSNQTTQYNNCQNTSNGNDSLWSFEEVTNILLNSLNELSKCKSKFDQVKVIANILQNVCK